MKDLSVRFESGRDVLNAYWGYLSDGGLVIPDGGELSVGEPVSLSVVIASASASYSLSGRVVRRDEAEGRAIIAFSPGQPHDMLLTQALADADKVPARRSRRFSVNLDASVGDRTSGELFAARVIDVSDHGCCIRLEGRAAGAFAVGAVVEVSAGVFRALGEVVWTHGGERGIVFAGPDDGRTGRPPLDELRAFVRSLTR